MIIMTQTTPLNPSIKSNWTTADRWIYRLSRNWILIFGIIFGIWVGLPFLPPFFMSMGWDGMAKAIYLLYSFQCHQLPQRSFFLFGSKAMYSLSEIQAVWQDTTNPLVLRQFLGNPEMGWKVAWSDRMVSMYTSLLIFGGFWWLLRRKLKPLPLWGLIILLMPMAVDGTSHLISDFAGIGLGFRDSNVWLASLTNNAFTPTFYKGDALGSFNSWMRLLTGIMFGLGIVWFSFPYLNTYFTDLARILKAKLQHSSMER
jgi:uncharacterized membrane protein